jgi:hypothetical protein
MPLGVVFPRRPSRFSRRLPLEAQETSYLAAPARISNLFRMFICFTTY